MSYEVIYFIGAVLLSVPFVKCVDSNVCSKNERETYLDTAPYRVTYIENYRESCRLIFTCRKTRINSYIAYKNVLRERYVNKYVCCDGYELQYSEYSANYDSQQSWQFYNSNCHPLCSSPCINGQCTKPNYCECSPGYETADHPNQCVPSCSNCVNGHCINPNECQCNFGYKESSSGGCEPVCTETCVNAICSAPDTCVCLTGFRKPIESNQCEPYCSSGCENGECIAPERCNCNDSYILTDGRCKPVCTGCVNGQCVKPGDCRCNVGYEKNNKDICQPHCDNCKNGTCVEPGNCTCNKGYAKNLKGFCIPECKEGCRNGLCVAPDVCNCLDGYKKIGGSCMPQCDICENGKCTAPEQCTCLEGHEYAENSTQRCIPVCKVKCSKEKNCIAPNTCSCKPGYKSYHNTTEICEPQCSKCSHGTCTAPETCSCSKGYKHPAVNITDRCVPICQLGCENGDCKAPDKCVCRKGYKLMRGTCFPYCKNCINGDCVSPGKCKCLDGYAFETNSTQTCVAKCDGIGGCDYGICLEPNTCLCDVGYNMDEMNKCVPKCDNCDENEVCSSPGTCECLPGYMKTGMNDTCIPSCDEDCENSTGCRLGCVNGTCSSPGVCECSCGFEAQALSDNNTYCILKQYSDDNCTMDFQNQFQEKRECMIWIYAGVSIILVSVLLALAVHQRRKIKRLASLGLPRRKHSRSSSSGNIYMLPTSVMADE